MNKLCISFLFVFIYNISFAQKNEILFLNFENNIKNQAKEKLIITPQGSFTFTKDKLNNPCGAGYFDGKSSLEINNNKLLNKIKKEFTLCVWLKLDPQKNGYWLTLICKGDTPTESPNSPQFRVQTFQGNTQSTISINTAFTEFDKDYKQHLFPVNEWFFYVLKYDGKNVSTFINDKLVWQFPYTKKLIKNESSLFIGKDIPGALEYFKGAMDDLRLFSKALKDDEIHALFESKNNETVVATKVLCPENVAITNDNGFCGAKVDYLKTVDNGCEKSTIRNLKGKASGSLFEIGKTSNVNEIASGANKSICSNTVEVTDIEKPSIVCNADTTVMIKDVYWEYKRNQPIVKDNCKIDSIWRRGETKLYLGEHTITYYASDVSKNTATCSEHITVKSIKIADKIINKKSYLFTTNKVTMVIYDNKKEDNDSISVFYNNMEIISKANVLNKKNGAIIKVLSLETNIDNTVVVQALNMGTVGKNTVKVDFYEGEAIDINSKALYSEVYETVPGFASGIILNRK